MAAAIGCDAMRARRSHPAGAGRAPSLPSWRTWRRCKPTLLPNTAVQMQLPLFSVHQEVLPSGLRLRVGNRRDARMGRVVTVFGTGSRPTLPTGGDWLTSSRPRLPFARKGGAAASDRLIRLGARYNADTSVDTTRYYEVAPASALTSVLQISAERIAHRWPASDEADFERERAIVENELNQRNEIGVYGRVVARMQAAMFPPGHPYARPIGGSPPVSGG
jgi:zinc protease